MPGLSGPVLVYARSPDVLINYTPFTPKCPLLDRELEGHPSTRHSSQLRIVSFSEITLASHTAVPHCPSRNKTS